MVEERIHRTVRKMEKGTEALETLLIEKETKTARGRMNSPRKLNGSRPMRRRAGRGTDTWR